MGWDIERIQVSSDQDLLVYRAKMIENLQEDLDKSGQTCKILNSENARLREEKEQLQEQYGKLLDKQVQDDYKVENAKKIVENLKKTIERFKEENEALRILLRLWM